jgi:hypothetical protein
MALPLAANSLIGTILDRIDVHGRSGRAYLARCPNPAHAGSVVSELIALKCFGNCDPAEVLLAIGLTPADLYPEDCRPTKPYELAMALRLARDMGHAAVMEVMRFETGILRLATQRVLTPSGLSEADEQRVALAQDRLRELGVIP